MSDLRAGPVLDWGQSRLPFQSELPCDSRVLGEEREETETLFLPLLAAVCRRRYCSEDSDIASGITFFTGPK